MVRYLQRGGLGGVRGDISYAGGRPEGVAPGGNPKGETSNALMIKGAADNRVGVCGGGISGRSLPGNNGPPPKGGGGVLGIGLVEVMWKVCAVLTN